MSELQKPLMRMMYKHLSGSCHIVWGFAVDFKEKDKTIVIMTNLSDAEITYFPLEKFFDKHPQTQQPRFELVTPKI